MSNVINQSILKFIKPKQKVLDCGCGNGDLLASLQKTNSISGYGIDIDSENIITCLQKGLSVYHGDITEGLKEFPDNAFDVVILSSTLQQIQNPVDLIHDMFRVAPKVIVTFPNFANWRCRFSLLRGLIPQTSALPYTWYNTPNIRVLSIKSFKKICKMEHVHIHEQVDFINNKISNTYGWSNFLAEDVLFVIGK